VQSEVMYPDENDEYWFHEGCHILEISNSDDDPDVSIARARVAPGVTTRWHRLQGVAERYLIVQGSGEVEIGTMGARRVTAGAVVSIPPATRQRIRNTGHRELVFYAICTPRFTPACYQALAEAPDQTQSK